MAKDLNLLDNKIIVLYVLQNSYPKLLTLDQIVKYLEEFDDITYFDICSYIDSMKKSGYIEELQENDNKLFLITDTGSATLSELLELIPGVNLYNLKKMINKNTVEIKTDYSIGTNIIPLKTDEYKISCFIKDGTDELINITMYAGTKNQAKNISKNWNENSETIYKTLLSLMTVDTKNEYLDDETKEID